MKNHITQPRHEPPCGRVALFATSQNLRKPQGRSKKLMTTYPLVLNQSTQEDLFRQSQQTLYFTFYSTGYLTPSCRGGWGLVDRELMLVCFTCHRCGHFVSRNDGSPCYPCKGVYCCAGNAGWGARSAGAGRRPKELVGRSPKRRRFSRPQPQEFVKTVRDRVKSI